MLRNLRFVLGGHLGRFAFLASAVTVNEGVMAATNTLAFKYLFDGGVMTGNVRFFITWSLFLISFWTMQRFLSLALTLAGQRLKNRIQKAASARMLEAFMRASHQHIIRKGEGYFISRVYEESKNATQPIVDSATRLISSLATAFVGAGLAMWLSLRLTIILGLGAFGLFYASQRFGARIQGQSREEQEEEARLREVTAGIIRAHKSILVFRLQALAHLAFARQFHRFAQTLFSRVRLSQTYATASRTFMSWVEVAVFLVAGYFIMIGELSIGGYLAYFTAFWIAANGISATVDLVPQFAAQLASVARLREFEEECRRDAALIAAQAPTAGEVQLEKVSFGYNGELVLREFDLTLRRGERVVLVGPNGSGKSTVAHLVAGLFQASSGSASVPGRVSALIEPVQFPPVPLREMMASLRAEEEGAHLAASFGLTEVLADRYDELSAGQKKKFGVLMALLKDADCYVLDEPIANVDDATKDVVMQAVLDRTTGRTLVVILHGDRHYYDRFDRVVELAQTRAASADAGEG